jgi:hypothetical protein
VTDQELRAMVRDAIARTASRPVSDTTIRCQTPVENSGEGRAAFALLPLPRGGDTDGMCIIEPSVRCTHCGYCQTFGH